MTKSKEIILKNVGTLEEKALSEINETYEKALIKLLQDKYRDLQAAKKIVEKLEKEYEKLKQTTISDMIFPNNF